MLGLRVRKGTVRFGRDGQSDMKRKAVVWSHDRAISCVGICKKFKVPTNKVPTDM